MFEILSYRPSAVDISDEEAWNNATEDYNVMLESSLLGELPLKSLHAVGVNMAMLVGSAKRGFSILGNSMKRLENHHENRF